MKSKNQGYNSRLDESMGARNGSNTQSMASRRNESKGAEKAAGKRAYSADSSMDKAPRRANKMSQRVVRLGNGGPAGTISATAASDLTSQHKRMAMGDSVPQGAKAVRMNMGGAAMKKMKRGTAPGGMNMGGAAMKKMKRGTSPGKRSS
tara:strand:+ start:545 stop:991 length:447 start_codon:yes stop_codon:yes gene_type:complete